MNESIIDIANRFLEEKDCSVQELTALKKWLSNPATHSEVENWLLEHWNVSSEVDSTTIIESVFQQIQSLQKKQPVAPGFSLIRILHIYRNVAAFLLIPIIGLGILFSLNQYTQSSDQYTETIALRGQKSQIILSDGTKVWLNSDTKIKYPGNFSKKQRDVYLDGEAFFEVTKNGHQPFIVHTSEMDVKVLGTKFNVKAYSDEDQVETSLFEGKVHLLYRSPDEANQIEKIVEPGQSFVYNKINHQLGNNCFPQAEINGWKNNQLIFKDDTFSNLVRKLERWYDVDVVYDQNLFNDRRLTVELYEGERLERLMEVISLALSVDYKYEKEKIILTPKNK